MIMQAHYINNLGCVLHIELKKALIFGINILKGDRMRKMEVGKIYEGFRLISEKKINEINSTGRVFIHEKTGAKLFHIENDDDNKVFSISFRTPPENSTGLPHILEHSVLCGSDKFPVKEPFVELVKGSLNTFLNAMTYSDKTMYPVASRNEKDFFNLMDVYMDAVLHPSIYKIPEIFMQEGWHYELENKDSDMEYRGVVYNEMKGAFSSPESILFRKVQESLYPDTPYHVESGGDPDVIPELTFEEFLDFHSKYYHPSNSYIFLYGDGDILKQLGFLNDNYLKYYDRIDIDSSIPLQPSFDKIREMKVPYPISSDEDTNDKAYISLNFSVGRSTDPEIYLAFEILEHMLLETPAAPLRKAIIDADLGKDVLGRFDNSIFQPVFSVAVKNSNEREKDRFKTVVYDTLRKLVEKGIDKELVEASINLKEFELREADFRGFPKGLLYNIKCMDSWLYDEEPYLHLNFEPVIEKIKQALKNDYFERLIKKYLLENTHGSLIVLEPSKGLSERKAREIKEKLSKYKAGLSDADIERIVNETKKLKERQMTPDTKEALDTIPMLALKDINPKAEEIPLSVRKENGRDVLFHSTFTGGIVYLNLYFNMEHVPKELVPYAGLLAEVYGKTSTEKYDCGTLSNQININTGGIEFNSEAYIENGSNTEFHPVFTVKSRALTERLPKAVELMEEIINHTKFDDKKRILEVIREAKSRFEMIMFDRGHVVASKRAASYFSPVSLYNELVSGFSFYKFIAEIEKDFDTKAREVEEKLSEVSELIFNRNNLLVSYTAEEKDYDSLRKVLHVITDNLRDENLPAEDFDFEISRENEGLMSPGSVQYVAKGYNFIELGYEYTGSLQVLQTIAGYDYLWNLIRVQGGAYGAFAAFGRGGNTYLSSYRDPNLKRTIDVFNGIKDYLKEFNVDEQEMTKYIIGTISRIDSPLTPSMKGERAAVNYISHITQEDLQSERDQILSCTQKDIQKLSRMLGDVMNQDCFCVLGSEKEIKESKDIFNKLINVFE